MIKKNTTNNQEVVFEGENNNGVLYQFLPLLLISKQSFFRDS